MSATLSELERKLEVAKESYGIYGTYVTSRDNLTDLQLEIYLKMIQDYNNGIISLENQITKLTQKAN